LVEILKSIRKKLQFFNVIRFIIIGDGLNYHKKIRIASNKKYDKSVTINSTKYIIDTKRFFIINRNPLERFKDWIQRNKKHFFIIYFEGDEKAISSPSPSKVPSNILDLAERSNILRNALREMFTTGISRRAIIFIIIAIIVAVLFMSIYKDGKLVLPDWM